MLTLLVTCGIECWDVPCVSPFLRIGISGKLAETTDTVIATFYQTNSIHKWTADNSKLNKYMYNVKVYAQNCNMVILRVDSLMCCKQ